MTHRPFKPSRNSRLKTAQKKSTHNRVLLAMMLAALLAASRQPERVLASDSDLDSSFGNGGIVTTDFLRGGEDVAGTVAIQTNGKIVVAGGNSGNFAVARYNPDGSLDSSFGNGGRVVTAIGNKPGSANALALQSDGKIVVAGSVRNSVTSPTSDFALARYNPDGSLDNSFDGDGTLTTHIGSVPDGFDQATAVAIQPVDGKIVVAGYALNIGTLDDFVLARYNLDGSLDTTFDGDGKVTTDFNNGQDLVFGIAIQPNGLIVAAGTTSLTTSTSIALARYAVDGSLDTSFGISGRVISDGHYQATAMTLQPDGKIVVVGWVVVGFFNCIVVRYSPDGNLDASFGTGGVVTTPASDSIFRGVVLQADGKIVAVGGNVLSVLLARYNPNGTLDNSFGSSGLIGIRHNNNSSDGFGVAIQGDGKIVGVGRARTQNFDFDFGLARVNVNGSLDTSFDGDGKVTTDFPRGPDSCNAMVIQPDGKIVLAGGNAGDFALARLNPDGSLDTSFGNLGRVFTDFLGGFDLAQGIALQPDGKIIAAGVATPANLSNTDFALARYNPDGSLDATFDGDGRVMTDFVGTSDQARAVAVQADGKIVAAGDAFFHNAFGVARYNPNGSLDASFDADGKVMTSLNLGANQAYGMVIQPGDHKIIVAGGTQADFALVRYNTDGSLDTTFDEDGAVVTSFISGSQAQAISLQSDGKIVAAGFTSGSNGFALARYNSNGSLDTTFDSDGKVTTNILGTSGDAHAYAVAIQSDGKIVAAGSARDEISRAFVFALARYIPDGSLDTTFGNSGTITTNIGSFERAATAVAIQPNDGKIVAAGVTSSMIAAADTDFAIVRYGGTDAIPPSIACPTGFQTVTTRPRNACATVTYPSPVVTDNLPGATVTCLPPSGACLPVGSTVVSCTATDAAGNAATCSFTITVFDVVLQSDSDHNVQLLINSFTGDYSFCCPQLAVGQSPLRGRGEARARGNTITLTHNAVSYRLLATIDASVGKGNASFKPVSGNAICPIQDRNIYDNLPLRCGNVAP